MTTEFKLPEVSEGVDSADVAEIHVAVGDVIEADQIVMEIETEKAVVDLPCPLAGKVAAIHVKEGQSVAIGELLLSIEETSGANSAPAQPPAESAPAETAPAETTPPAAAEEPPPVKEDNTEDNNEVAKEAPVAEPAANEAPAAESSTTAVVSKGTVSSAVHQNVANAEPTTILPAPAAPSTRRLARQLGVDLHKVPGTGAGGRITVDDVQSFVRTITSTGTHDVHSSMSVPTLPDFTNFGPIERVPQNKLARTSAENLSLSWRTVPHVTQHDLADITALEHARKRYMENVGRSGPKLTMTAIIVKAVVGALKAYPQFNSSLDKGTDELILKRYYHIGVAVDTDFGLVVPVIRDADRKTVIDIAAEIGHMAELARDRKLQLSQMQGGTFTITNLGGIGGSAFTPIINYPEVAILGMSRSQKQLALVDGQPSERLMLPLSLSYDHRVINGADAARFIVKLSKILSDFFQLLVEC